MLILKMVWKEVKRRVNSRKNELLNDSFVGTVPIQQSNNPKVLISIAYLIVCLKRTGWYGTVDWLERRETLLIKVHRNKLQKHILYSKNFIAALLSIQIVTILPKNVFLTQEFNRKVRQQLAGDHKVFLYSVLYERYLK